MSLESTLDATIGAALAGLLAARNWQGWWVDFRLAPGFSDEWVTGYVGSALAALREPEATAAATAGWSLLRTRSHLHGSWAYNAFPPGDADSTCWALHLAASLGELDDARARLGASALDRHVRADDGITTYADEAAIRRFVRAPAERSFSGWCGSHPCVSAAVAGLAGYRPRVSAYLRRTQRDDGSWGAYWWADDAYSTALAAEALAQSGEEGDAGRVGLAAAWARRRLTGDGCAVTPRHPGGSPFATAWCVRLLLLRIDDAEHRAALARAAHWLQRAQHADGLWEPSAPLRVPLPEDEHPECFERWTEGGRIEGSIVFDQHRVFTTASVLAALQRVRRAGAGTHGSSMAPAR